MALWSRKNGILLIWLAVSRGTIARRSVELNRGSLGVPQTPRTETTMTTSTTTSMTISLAKPSANATTTSAVSTPTAVSWAPAAATVSATTAITTTLRVAAPTSASALISASVPQWFMGMLRRRQLWIALITSTVYGPDGRMKVGDTAKVRLPLKVKTGRAPICAELKLLHRIGRPGDHSMVTVWLGDPAIDGHTIYVVFQPVVPRNAVSLARKIFKEQKLVSDIWDGEHIILSTFVKRKVRHIWYDKGLRTLLRGKDGVLQKYLGYRLVFTGASHGATMAQAVGLRFAISLKKMPPEITSDVFIVDWNSYRWTTESAASLQGAYLSDRAIHMSMRDGKDVDAAAGFPRKEDGFSNLDGHYTVEVRTGRVDICSEETNCPQEAPYFVDLLNIFKPHKIVAGVEAMDRFKRLHFAKLATIPGMKRVTLSTKAVQKDCDELCKSTDSACSPLLHDEGYCTVKFS